LGNLKEIDELEKPEAEGTILKLTDGRAWGNLYGRGYGPLADCCECGNEHTASIKCG
jgi:hypothetical protein